MKGTFPDPPSHERNWGVHFSSPSSAGTAHYYLGRSRGGLFVVRDILLFSSTAVARSAVSYYTYRPFVVAVTPGAGAAVHYIGTPRASNVYAIPADDGFRIHDEMSLDYHLAQGMALGVEVVTTGTPTSVRQTILGSLDYAG